MEQIGIGRGAVAVGEDVFYPHVVADQRLGDQVVAVADQRVGLAAQQAGAALAGDVEKLSEKMSDQGQKLMMDIVEELLKLEAN